MFTELIAGVMLIAVLAIAFAGHTRRGRPRSSADGVAYAGDGGADCGGGSADGGCDGGGGGN